MISLRTTIEYLREDWSRFCELYQQVNNQSHVPSKLHLGYISVVFFRISHMFFVCGHRILARVIWHINLLITGADLSPLSDIGPGFVILHPVCVTVVGKAGKNFTVVSRGGLGAGLGRADIGPGIGLPVLGDDITLPPLSMVLGPVKIGNRVKIPAGTIITKNLSDNAYVTNRSKNFMR